MIQNERRTTLYQFKKIMINDENNNQEYGRRLRLAITLCGMKLPAFGKKYAIAISHLYSIERGVRTLNPKTAERIAQAVRQEGYFCTTEWLLTGLGPQPCKSFDLGHEDNGDDDEHKNILYLLTPEIKIMKEADFFQRLNGALLLHWRLCRRYS
jgi:transcriptional regulator with XRE-family HTH domain